MKRLEEKINYQFNDKKLLEKSLTHKSWANEAQSTEHNEKLEFLGDAVLDLALSELLYEHFPNDDEGGLSKKRASLVNEDYLYIRAQSLGLNDFIKLGKGEIMSNGGQKPRLLSSCYEALIGALYLDGSWEKVRDFIRKEYYPTLLNFNEESYQKDYKTRLQEKMQGEHRDTPTYELVKEEGPPHDRRFQVQILFRGQTLSSGEGKTKKSAEQSAAKIALEKMEEGELP
ncbi:MAG: ribonuclease III [Bdellovibrionota bacterium]